MQDALHPNRLKELLSREGYKLGEVAHDATIAYRTLRRYANGEQVIPRRDRIKLAQLIGCSVDDLGPQYDVSIQRRVPETAARQARGAPMFGRMDRHFMFGKIKTSLETLDGTGIETYVPGNIHTHFDPEPAIFFDEVMEAKKEVEHEQAELHRTGRPSQWNGAKYHLSGIVVGRESAHENMTLGLWFKPRDHFTGLATRRCLDMPDFRKKYLEDNDWYTPVVGMSMSMGVDLLVVSADGFAILTQRGAHQSVHQNMYHVSVSEAVSPTLDWSAITQSPDLYRTAMRGLTEELGLRESIDFSVSDIQFLSFTVDTHYALYGLRGLVKVNKSADEIMQKWHSGVKDKVENKMVSPVRFTPEDIATFVFSPDRHESWGGGLICLYHSLVHDFGYERVDRVIDSYS